MFTIKVQRRLSSWALPSIGTNQNSLFDQKPLNSNDFDVSELEETDTKQLTQISIQIQRVAPQDLFSCEICGREFITREVRNKHIETHFNTFECPDCKQTFVGDRQFEHHKRNRQCHNEAHANARTYECFECHKGNFFSRHSLKLHVNRSHRSEAVGKDRKRDRCAICGKTFANVYIMRNHMTEIHRNSNKFECDVCGKRFNRQTNMNLHRLIHENKMPCKCNICGKSFRSTSGVNLHKRMHTGEKPHKCDICNEKAYSYNTDLKRHKRSAHGIVDKVFPCPICTMTFYEPKFLRKHLRKLHPTYDTENEWRMKILSHHEQFIYLLVI